MSGDAPPRVTDAEVHDLRDRVRRARRVDAPAGGIPPERLTALLDRWGGGYDWRAHEERIRSRPWRLVAGEVPIRLVHLDRGPGAPVVVLLHGWPDSVLRFDRVLPLLDDCTVLVPALPGFPFAAPVGAGGLSAAAIGDAIGVALRTLGVGRCTVSAGDVGTDVAEALHAAHEDLVASLHLTDVSQYRFLVDPPEDLTAEERAYVARGHAWQAAEGGYMHEQSTRPATVAAALADSPAGLLAWIAEKLDAWTDGVPGEVLPDDDLLTWVSAYWFGRAVGTSFTPYAVASPKPRGRVRTPTVLTLFPEDLVNAPRAFAERFFDVREFREEARGGHFAAWEDPEAYVSGVRAAVRLAR